MQKAELHPEWIATVAFYKAVQIVEAVFAHDLGKHSHGHDDRLETLKLGRFHHIYRHYRPLDGASRIARYLIDSRPRPRPEGKIGAFTCFTDYMPANRVVHRLIKKRLKPLEEHSLSHLSEQAKDALLMIETA